jgi:hypothetical protein
MSTHDVPGANPDNADRLAAGCWAEHDDGSLLYIKGTELGRVIYELYDMDQDPPVYYQDAMFEDAFKKAFSHPPVGASDEDWTWHDKTPFPWDRVMKNFDKPRPQHADVEDQLSAAARVAESLKLRARKLRPESVAPMAEQAGAPKAARGIVQRLQKALEAFVE